MILQLVLHRLSVPMLNPRALVLLLRAHNPRGRAAIRFLLNYSSKNSFQILINKIFNNFVQAREENYVAYHFHLFLLHPRTINQGETCGVVLLVPLSVVLYRFLLFQESATPNQSSGRHVKCNGRILGLQE